MDTDFSRYSCQIALPGFGEAAQQALQNAKVLIVGAGGLGCPAAQYLVGAGVGTIGIADFDEVSISNLHRQVLYGPADIGHNKAAVAAERLRRQNPSAELVVYEVKITSDNVADMVSEYDIVVDCTDNFDTRYLLNDACVLNKKPVVYGAIYQFEGQVAVWNVAGKNNTRTPNYRDLYPKVNAAQIPNCTEGGVIPSLAGIIGCMQANEVIKYITQTGELLAGKVLIFDALTMQSRVVKIGSVTKAKIISLPQTAAVPLFTADELKFALRTNSVELVDVRNEQERAGFQIGGKHIPIAELENNLDQINPSAVTVFYCASGKRSAEAVNLVKEKIPGIQVFSLQGGLREWLVDSD
jgi:molybdopterin/thiamine biosynthesis adenylyltransferase/rhodanese-related sulfurtransferase